MDNFKTLLLLSILTALFVFVGYNYLGTVGLIAALIFSLVMNITAYWFSDAIILASTDAREYSLTQYAILNSYVTAYCEKLNIPVPKFYLITDESPNAFATGRDPEHAIVCLTTGLIDLLTIEELVAVVAHELGHIKSRDILTASIAAVMVGALSGIADIAYWGTVSSSDRRNNSPIGFLLGVLIAPLTATILFYAISRTREYTADETSARTLGTSQPLITALRKIHSSQGRIPTALNRGAAALCILNPFDASAALEIFSTHPSLENRIERLLRLVV